MIAVAVACGSYLLGASVTPSASGDIGGRVGVSKARGLDSCELPRVAALRYIWNHFYNDFHNAYLGFYVGGVTAYPPGPGGCVRPTKAQINQLHAIGYDFLPIMDGRQPPCSPETSSHFSEDPTEGFLKAREAAADEVDAAIKRMAEVGFTTPGSIVYYDFETFNQNANHPNCLAAAKAFINNWDRRLKKAYGASSGFYGPVVGAHVDEFWNLAYNPDDLWYSEIKQKNNLELNEEYESVWAVPANRIPDDHWPHRRLHQWEKDIGYKTENGDHFEMDFSCAMGLVAGSGGKREEPKCLAK